VGPGLSRDEVGRALHLPFLHYWGTLDSPGSSPLEVTRVTVAHDQIRGQHPLACYCDVLHKSEAPGRLRGDRGF
jgi:hypothetical protein